MSGTSQAPAADLFPDSMLKDRYRIDYSLFEDDFVYTYAGMDISGCQKVWIQEFRKHNRHYGEDGTEEILLEGKILQKNSVQSGIINVLDYFEENGIAYYICGYMDGESLSGFLERNKILSAKSVFKMVSPLLNALEKLIEYGVLYTNISPENLFIKYEDGEDIFVLTRLRKSEYNNGGKNIDSGKSFYTPLFFQDFYSAPELCDTMFTPDIRADIYSLAAIIYRCISGYVPPSGMERIFNDTLVIYPPSGCPEEIVTILDKAMAVDPADRYQSIAEFREDIEKVYPPRQSTLSYLFKKLFR